MKKHNFFLQKTFFRIIFHIFRDIKTRNFEDFGHVFAIYNRKSYSKSMDFWWIFGILHFFPENRELGRHSPRRSNSNRARKCLSQQY